MQLPISIALSSVELEPDERQLVEQAKRDREAFALLYRRNHALMAGYIFRRCGDRHVTEDLVAEVFLTALRCLPRYRDRGLPVRAWLYRIAANAVNRWVRGERRGIRRRLAELVSDGSTGVVAETKSGSSHDDADMEYVRLALLTLRPKYQTVLSLHYLEGMNLEEIAAAVGCRLGTVKSRLSRGREAMKVLLERRRSNS